MPLQWTDLTGNDAILDIRIVNYPFWASLLVSRGVHYFCVYVYTRGYFDVKKFANMPPQTFRVVRCYKCGTFQVEQVKKSNKWKCKLCGEAQSLKKVLLSLCRTRNLERSSPSYWYENLVPVTLLICHAFWYQICLEHVLLLPSFWYEVLAPVTWAVNFLCTIGLTSLPIMFLNHWNWWDRCQKHLGNLT